MGSPTYLYHYTNYEGVFAIEKSGVLRGSSNKTGVAAYGEGVYLTSLDPSTPTKILIENNWDGNQARLVQIAREKRTEYYYKFHIASLAGVVKVGDSHGRDVWLYPGDIKVIGTGVKFLHAE